MGMIIRTFFWWTWWNTPSLQDDTPWFVEILNDSWNTENTISTWNSETNTTQTGTQRNIHRNIQRNTWNNTPKEYDEIKIIIPKYFYNSGWNEFAKDIYNEDKILISFSFIDDLNLYRDSLSDSNFSEADLFLFPYDWRETTRTLEFPPINNIEWSFDSLISPLIKDKKIQFLPFAADPMIMYSTVNLPYNNFSEISNLVYSRESNIQLAFPIFFWITKEDYWDEWFLREYQDIMRYALLHYFKKYQDSHSLWIRINSNIPNSNEFRNYNIWDLNNIANTITQIWCKNFPSICFQLYNFVGIRFWFLSDKDIVHNYFPRKESNFEKISKYPLPFYSIESPIRVRWFWISENINNVDTANAINKILVHYIDNHDKYNLWNSTLSVFKDEWNLPLIDEPYIWSRWYILDAWWNYMDTLRGSNSFRQLLDSQISANNFLKK